MSWLKCHPVKNNEYKGGGGRKYDDMSLNTIKLNKEYRSINQQFSTVEITQISFRLICGIKVLEQWDWIPRRIKKNNKNVNHSIRSWVLSRFQAASIQM